MLFQFWAMQSSKREHIIDYHYFWFIISLDCMGSYGQHGQEIGTAGHASTSTSRGATRANVAGIPSQVIEVVTLGALVGEEGPPLGSVLVLMLGLVIGTALLALVEHTTLLAAQAASSVEHSRMTRLPVAMTLISLAHEALGVAAVAAVVLDLDGNLVTGFAAGLDATSTILRAEWNVSDAMPQGTRSRHVIPILGNAVKQERAYHRLSLLLVHYFFGLHGFLWSTWY
nr:hypothetical protein CFP56_47873 [Quercus suber]